MPSFEEIAETARRMDAFTRHRAASVLGGRTVPLSGAETLSRRQAIVTAVNATTSTATLNLGGQTITDAATIGWYYPQVGDTVFVEILGGDALIIGTVGNKPRTMTQLATVRLDLFSSLVDFQGIPPSFTHLRIVYSCTSNDVQMQEMFLRFDNHSGSTYEWVQLDQLVLTTSTAAATAANSMKVGLINGSNVSPIPSGGVIDIYDYALFGSRRTVTAHAVGRATSSQPRMRLFAGLETSLDQTIQSIQLLAGSGTFRPSNVFSLYGVG